MSFFSYLFGALLLFHTVSHNNVNNFPPEPLNYSLEAALLPCREVDNGMLVMHGCVWRSLAKGYRVGDPI